MHHWYLWWNLHAASSASLLLHREPAIFQTSPSLSPCLSVLTAREVADSPTKSNVRFKTEDVLFQIPTIPRDSKFQKKQIYVRVLTVLLTVVWVIVPTINFCLKIQIVNRNYYYWGDLEIILSSIQRNSSIDNS